MQTPVDTAGELIVRGPGSFLVKNRTATASIFCEVLTVAGGAAASTATGFEWQTSDPPLSLELGPGEGLYGILAAAQPAQTVHYLAGHEGQG